LHLFYSPGLAEQEEWILSPDESHHAVKVLRLGPGADVVLVNGKGGWFQGRIIQPDPRGCRIEILGMEAGKGQPTYALHVAMAPTKQIDRFEWFVEKASEIGISEITPLICDRSERKEVKTERIIKVAVAAMKQSLKAWHPEIHEPVPFKKFIDRNFQGSSLMIAHCNEGSRQWIDQCAAPGQPIVLLIGPEGDFSPDEIIKSVKAGFREITLGESRLRTETAGLVAVQTIAWLNR
jgi:16S rRNA (uracil1498-N3)-methyltransferase